MNKKLQGILYYDRDGDISIPEGLEDFIKSRWPDAIVVPLLNWSGHIHPEGAQPSALLVTYEGMETPKWGYRCFAFGITSSQTFFYQGTDVKVPIHLWYCLPSDDPFNYIRENFPENT